jgi:4-hydroxy-tetrahydrodipicolinate synthase
MNTPDHKLGGVVPPIVTPLTADGDVDVPSLENLVGFLLEAGVSGLFALGSSGESAYLTDQERDRVLEVVVGAAAGQVPVLAGAIETTSNRVIERGAVAHKLGADAVVATAPFYTRTHPAEIERHFRLVNAAVDLPLFAYDIPVSVNVKLSTELLIGLASDGVVAGVKDSSGDDAAFRQTVLAARCLPSFAVFTGHEVMVDAMMLAGADGAVPGLANVDPHGFVRLLRLCADQDWAAAKDEQDRLAGLFDIVRAASPATASGSTGGLGAFKTALVARGVIAGNTMAPPMRPLDAAETQAVRARLDEAGLL